MMRVLFLSLILGFLSCQADYKDARVSSENFDADLSLTIGEVNWMMLYPNSSAELKVPVCSKRVSSTLPLCQRPIAGKFAVGDIRSGSSDRECSKSQCARGK